MHCFPGSVSMAVINAMIKGTLGRKGFVSDCILHSLMKGSQGKNPEQELGLRTATEATGNSVYWAVLPGRLCHVLNSTGRPALPMGGLGHPTSILSQGTGSQTFLKANLIEAIPQL